MRKRTIVVLGLFGFLAAITLGAVEPRAEQACARGDHWCAKQCGAWNNWCRPACGDWNAWCAGQSLPNVISRMQPRGFFADPKWYGGPDQWPSASGDKRD